MNSRYMPPEPQHQTRPETLLAAEIHDDETPDEEPLDDESLENATPQWQEQQPLTSAGRISPSRTSPFSSIMSF